MAAILQSVSTFEWDREFSWQQFLQSFSSLWELELVNVVAISHSSSPVSNMEESCWQQFCSLLLHCENGIMLANFLPSSSPLWEWNHGNKFLHSSFSTVRMESLQQFFLHSFFSNVRTESLQQFFCILLHSEIGIMPVATGDTFCSQNYWTMEISHVWNSAPLSRLVPNLWKALFWQAKQLVI